MTALQKYIPIAFMFAAAATAAAEFIADMNASKKASKPPQQQRQWQGSVVPKKQGEAWMHKLSRVG